MSIYGSCFGGGNDDIGVNRQLGQQGLNFLIASGVKGVVSFGMDPVRLSGI